MTSKQLRDFYYDNKHTLWTGQEAIDRLYEFLITQGKNTKTAKTAARKFLAKQAIWQIHLPPPKKVQHPHYQVYEPNKLGMVDLVSMPGDKLYGNKYKHMLVYVDVASGFLVIRPLRNKTAKDTAFAMKDILKVVHPEQIYSDAGTEFKGVFKKLLDEQGIKYKSEVTKYHHGFTGPVDVAIRNITIKFFRRMDAQELLNPEEVSTTWVKYLQQEVQSYNNRFKSKIGMSPAEAFKLDNVKQKRKPYPKEKLLPEDGLYRYLLKPGEEHKDSKRRATDNIWSRKTFRLSDIEQIPEQRVIYHISDGPQRAFVREELMLIPEDTQLPPDWVKKW